MTQTAHIVDEYNLVRPKIVLHETEALTIEARLAATLVERWGMVAGTDGGEDSQGRAKLKLQSPTEVVARACETAELLMAEIRRRKWFVEVPPWDEIQKQAKELREKDHVAEDLRRVERATNRAKNRHTDPT